VSAREAPRKGRGATSNRSGRYESLSRDAIDDGWGSLDEPLPRLATTLEVERSQSVLSFNRSPDVPFDRSVNPYRGCEHGCIYCYARPTHAWLGLSPGLDFETRLFHKPDAAEVLCRELAAPGYRCAPICLGANTDPYQPVERRAGTTRAILEVLLACAHPLRIVTKSALVERDLDLLTELASRRLCSVSISLTTLTPALARVMEPRASAPARRLAAIERLAAAGVPVQVLVAPVIPFVNDDEMESILEQAHAAGAWSADYVLIRLPLEIRELFQEWLRAHFPERAERVMNRIRDCRGGRDYDGTFDRRMRGTGVFAELLARRFAGVCRRLGLVGDAVLDCSRFAPPELPGQQLRLL
jgi:DNA repair photolyase